MPFTKGDAVRLGATFAEDAMRRNKIRFPERILDPIEGCGLLSALLRAHYPAPETIFWFSVEEESRQFSYKNIKFDVLHIYFEGKAKMEDIESLARAYGEIQINRRQGTHKRVYGRLALTGEGLCVSSIGAIILVKCGDPIKLMKKRAR